MLQFQKTALDRPGSSVFGSGLPWTGCLVPMSSVAGNTHKSWRIWHGTETNVWDHVSLGAGSCKCACVPAYLLGCFCA